MKYFSKYISVNSTTKVGIATMANGGRTMMNWTNVKVGDKHKLFRLLVTVTAKLDMLMVVGVKGSTAIRYMHWVGVLPKYIKYLKAWEKLGR